MFDNPIFSFDDTISANLAALSEIQLRDEERRICELSALADSAVSVAFSEELDGMDIYGRLAFISDAFMPSSATLHAEALEENVKRLSAFGELICASDKVFLSHLLVEKLGKRGYPLSESDFLFSSHIGGRIVYVKNGYSDEAFDVFSAEISNARVGYVESLRDAVREVLDDRAQYCLLPLEERGARIASVEELLFSNELRIAALTPVFGYDGAADMKYALVSKHFRIPKMSKGDEKYIEIMLPSDGEPPLGELLLATSMLGHSLYRVKGASFKTADGMRDYYTAVFRESGDFCALLVYLTLFAPTASIMGIYKNLE